MLVYFSRYVKIQSNKILHNLCKIVPRVNLIILLLVYFDNGSKESYELL